MPARYSSIFIGLILCLAMTVISLFVFFSVVNKYHLKTFASNSYRLDDIPYAEEQFIKQWQRMLKARVDWKAILAPCEENMEWNSTMKEDETSANTSYIEFMDIRPAGQFSRLFVRTRTKDSRHKTIGGDFWMVMFKGPADVSPTVFDHRNGSYEALVLLAEPGSYRVEWILQYTLCAGIQDPPEPWFRKGFQGRGNGDLIKDGRKLNDYEMLQGGRKIVIEVPAANENASNSLEVVPRLSCQESCRFIWYGQGRWIKRIWTPFMTTDNHAIDPKWTSQNGTKPSDNILFIGDSITMYFAQNYNNQRRNTWRNVFNTTTWLSGYMWVYPKFTFKGPHNREFNPEIVTKVVVDHLRMPMFHSKKSVVVLNYGLHYALGINFTTFQALMENITSLVKNRRKLFGSDARVVWKTTTGMHYTSITQKSRFLTSHRVRLYAAYALSIMCKNGIDILDVYPMSASTDILHDYLHFSPWAFRKAEDALTWYGSKDPGEGTHDLCFG